jgi:hypothetical protein
MALLLLLACHHEVAPADPLAVLATPSDAVRSRTRAPWTTIPAGGTVTLLDVDGPGRIVRMWMTVIGDPEPGAGRRVGIEMYWDGATEPAVRVPVGDFFGAGHGEPAEIVSVPVLARGTGYTAYWRMPFAAGARIVLRNDGPRDAAVYWQVDWDRVPVRAVEPYRFQASWRREAKTTPGVPFTLAEIEGEGRYVGTVLAIDPRSRGWWGEGDELYYVDGAAEPSVQGTGTEDFVQQAWGLIPLSTPFAGAADQKGRHVSLYRWQIEDPLPFTQSLVVKLQQQGKPVLERSDDVSGTAYWYQAPPLTPVPVLPPADARMPAPPLREERWTTPGDTVPVDLSGVADASRVGGSWCLPNSPHIFQRPAGVQTVAGVGFDILECCQDRPSALLLDPGERATVAVPAGGPALWLFLAGTGSVGKPALLVRDGETVTTLGYGDALDSWADPWPVPNGRLAFAIDQANTMRGGYVTWLPVSAGGRTLTLEAAPDSTVTIYGMSRGAAPEPR